MSFGLGPLSGQALGDAGAAPAAAALNASLALTLGALGLTATASSGTLYVATTGLDTNAGTFAAPFLTIAHAASVAVAGNLIIVANGNYPGGFTTSCAGTSGHPITFRAANRWGARIIPPSASSTDICWQNDGAYITLDGFEVDGSTDPITGPRWRIGLRVDGEGSIVRNCHVHHIFRAGIETSSGGSGILLDSAYGGMNMQALGNFVHHIGAASGTTGLWFHCIYITASGSVSNNIVGVSSGGGIQAWHDVHNLDIANNTIFACDTGIVYGGGDYVHLSGPADYITVTNNIITGCQTGIRELGDVGTHNVIAYNQVVANGTNYFTFTVPANNITGTLGLLNYQANASGDYHLTSASAAIDAGLATYAPAVDFDGYARPNGAAIDVGAYEYRSGAAAALQLAPATLVAAATGAVAAALTKTLGAVTSTASVLLARQASAAITFAPAQLAAAAASRISADAANVLGAAIAQGMRSDSGGVLRVLRRPFIDKLLRKQP